LEIHVYSRNTIVYITNETIYVLVIIAEILLQKLITSARILYRLRRNYIELPDILRNKMTLIYLQ